MLESLHTNFLNGSYLGDRTVVIKVSENNSLFRDPSQTNIPVRIDSVGRAVIGYGYDLLGNSLGTLLADLETVNSSLGTNVTLSDADRTLLEEYQQGQRTANEVRENLQLRLPTEKFASELLQARAQEFETELTTLLTNRLGSNMANSRERAALVSMAFNGSIGLISGKLMDQIAAGNRAEAWYEIRHNTNAGKSRVSSGGGIAKRRYMESHLFGLYEDGTTASTIDEEEAKAVYKMYTKHREKILREENLFSSRISDNPGGNANTDYQLVGTGNEVQTLQESFMFAFGKVKELFIDPLSAGITIDVLDVQIGGDEADLLSAPKRDGFQLGTGDEKNDLMLGEGGNDVLEGRGGDDILYGGDGVDTLDPGTGKAFLFGGKGADVYKITALTDTITIKDDDGKGIIVFDPDGEVTGLVGGTREAGSGGAYKIPDPEHPYQVSYSWSGPGADLTIKIDGQPGRIILKQFGRELRRTA
ncbi:MAG: hypothetical protein BMS9Abin05_2398 [Rhodothermia bacterium]|nr:MAG: hypothetical protein BMS9Abin05_2398 [Rhodothermia bacterium]